MGDDVDVVGMRARPRRQPDQHADAADLDAAVQAWLAQPGPALLDVVTSRMELVMPPFVGAQQAMGTALYSAKAVLAGRAGDVWELVSDNLG